MNKAPHYFPRTLELCVANNIKMYLGPCKIVHTLAGKWCLVSPIFGAGYYGSFDLSDGAFWPTKACKQSFIELLAQVEEGGLDAVASIGAATGMCCICGRTLTDEESIASGIGKICAGKVGYTQHAEL